MNVELDYYLSISLLDEDGEEILRPNGYPILYPFEFQTAPVPAKGDDLTIEYEYSGSFVTKKFEVVRRKFNISETGVLDEPMNYYVQLFLREVE